MADESGRVVNWLICKIWTDEARYFGTDRLRKQYEERISKRIKVKFLGVPKDFVGTEVNQNLENGLAN